MNISQFRDEWHPTKNLPLVFITTLPKSGKYWWVGRDCGHEWQATLNKRTGKGSGCLVCSSLALVHPDLASEWHPTKNGDLGPVQISAKASGKYWWVGACGHEWEDYLHERTNGRECHVCSGKQLVVGFNDLTTVNPSVSAEWHPTKNGDLSPDQFLSTSKVKAWWLCSENHEWEASIPSRAVKAVGCPFCTNKKLLVGFNDFATVNPNLVSEWHPTKNGELTPEQFITVSATKAWWLGECGHEWETPFVVRSKGSRCPYCINQKVLVGFNDLATLNPILASEWHPTKNEELTPEDVFVGSGSKVWWLGECGHEWEATVFSRNGGINCPVCEHPESYDKELITGTNDLVSVEPEIASQWHPTKNGDLTPDSVVRMFDEKVWWVADCGYEWEATPKSRKTTDCPECIRLRIKRGVNDLTSADPVIVSEWHPTKNSPLIPQHISTGSEKKVWWLGVCGHEWEAIVKNRVGKGSKCSVCRGYTILVGFNDLATINPEIASEWHPTKNGDLTPQQVTAKGAKKVWWLGGCGHEWETAIQYRSKGGTCPVCSGQRKFNGRTFLGRNVNLGVNDLATTHPEIAAEWHPTKNGDLNIQQLTANSGKDVWWRGASCGHEWDTKVFNRTLKGFGCPVCSNHRVSVGINDLSTTNPEIAAEWHPTKNGDLNPNQLTPVSHKKVWWLGECGHEWEYEVRHRVQKEKGCRICK